MTDRLLKSKDFTEEYCCSVVKVGELTPVENSDNLMLTRINGESIVVNKQDVSEGDVMLYVSNECQIGGWFLSANNMYRHHTMNHNRSEVEARLKEDPDFLKSNEARKMTGYFEDNGRVRMIKLRGCPSFGVLFRPDTMERALRYQRFLSETRTDQPPTEGIDWQQAVGQDFDTIDGYQFVRPYVPKRNEPRQGHGQKGVSRWDRFDRMVPGQFKLHYDTAPLKKHLMDFKPQTRITATVKMHGTSFICGNVLVNTPLPLFRLRRFVNRLLRRDLIAEMRQDYGMVVSSRKVIKNEWANCQHPEGFYGVDIWTEYANIIFPYIPKGYTIYGEICGYLTDSQKMIQKDYDYGCPQGQNFLMPYRVTKHEDGRIRDLSIEEVGRMTAQIKAAMHDAGDKNAGRLVDIRGVRIFDGTVEQLTGIGGDIRDFPDRLADRCNIEQREQLCTSHNVPREGVVVRIEGDEVPEAFKLKSLRFLEREKKAIDKGEVDMEMTEVADAN